MIKKSLWLVHDEIKQLFKRKSSEMPSVKSSEIRL